MSENISQEITLRDLVLKINEWFIYLRSKWIIVLLAGIIGIALGYVYAVVKKPEYTAISTFVLEDSNTSGAMGQYAGLASMMGIDLGGGGSNGIFQGDNIIELYKSRAMIQQTLLTESVFDGKKQLLADRYIEFNHLKEEWTDRPELRNINFSIGKDKELSNDQNSVLGEIFKEISRNNLVVSKPDKKLNIIKVQVNSQDELFAKAFADEMVKNVNDFYVQTKTKKSLQNVAILQHQTDSIRMSLNSAIFGMASAVDANPNANAARQVLRVPSQKRQIDAQANTAILTELVKNLELSKVSLRRETPLIQIIDSPVLPLNKVVLGKPKSMIIGAILAIMLTAIFLIVKRGFKTIVS